MLIEFRILTRDLDDGELEASFDPPAFLAPGEISWIVAVGIMLAISFSVSVVRLSEVPRLKTFMGVLNALCFESSG